MLANPEQSQADCEHYVSFLSKGLPPPRQTETVDGLAMLEWAYRSNGTLRIVFPGNDTINWKAAFGKEQLYGSTIMPTHIDILMMRLIKRVYPPTVRAMFLQDGKIR